MLCAAQALAGLQKEHADKCLELSEKVSSLSAALEEAGI